MKIYLEVEIEDSIADEATMETHLKDLLENESPLEIKILSVNAEETLRQ